jgi:hypothetical protein
MDSSSHLLPANCQSMTGKFFIPLNLHLVALCLGKIKSIKVAI